MRRLTLAAAGLAGAAVGACAVLLLVGERGPADRPAIETAVREYMLSHPEIIAEALDKERIDPSRAALERPFASAWAGNPKGDVTVVEFTDYACGFCRASVRNVDRLVAEDPGVRVVYREVALISPESGSAARAALAAAQSGRHAAFHRALFAGGPLGPAQVAAAARTAGSTVAPTDPAIDRELADNLALARAIRLGGTPTFVIGNRVLTGAIDYDTLKGAVAAARTG